jgi:chromosomal replication initiation ATPase DnaA
MSPLKNKVVTRARYAVIWGLFRTTELGYAPLGRLVDRDHSTVMSGFRRFATHVEVNPSIGEKLRACEHQARIAMHDAFGE